MTTCGRQLLAAHCISLLETEPCDFIIAILGPIAGNTVRIVASRQSQLAVGSFVGCGLPLHVVTSCWNIQISAKRRYLRGSETFWTTTTGLNRLSIQGNLCSASLTPEAEGRALEPQVLGDS